MDKCLENALVPSHIFDLRAFAPLYFNEFGSEPKSRPLTTQSERVAHLHIETHKKKTLWILFGYPRVKNDSLQNDILQWPTLVTTSPLKLADLATERES